MISNNPITFIRLVFTYGPVNLKRSHVLLIYLLKIFITLPFSLIEYIFYRPSILKSRLEQSPIFIIGHYRSGTTYLHKLMSADSQFGCFRNSDMFAPYSNGILRLFSGLTCWLVNLMRIKNLHYNKTFFQLDDPQEEEMCLACMFEESSSYWAYVFPKRADEIFRKWVNLNDIKSRSKWRRNYDYALKKTSIKNKGKRMVLKNPVNTGRVRELIALYPDAKFVFLYRNPIRVFQSMKRIWERVVLKNYALQKIDSDQVNKIIINHYKQLMSAYDHDRVLIPAENLVELSFEDLETDSFQLLERIYSQFNIKIDTEALTIAINKQSRYKNFQYKPSKEVQSLVAENLGGYVKRWGYGENLNIGF